MKKKTAVDVIVEEYGDRAELVAFIGALTIIFLKLFSWGFGLYVAVFITNKLF